MPTYPDTVGSEQNPVARGLVVQDEEVYQTLKVLQGVEGLGVLEVLAASHTDLGAGQLGALGSGLLQLVQSGL